MSSVFWDYYTDERPPRNLIREWYGKQDDRVRGAFDGVIQLLEAMPDWSELRHDPVKALERECAGLWEVVIDIKDKRPFRRIRPIGLWHPDERIFVFLGAFEKSGMIKSPADACQEALKHKARYESGNGVIDGHI